MANKPNPPTSKPSSFKKKHHEKTRKRNQLRKWIGIGLGVIVVLVAIIVLNPKTTGAKEISVEQAYQKYQQGAFFLDVRSQEEWDQVHIASSKLIPLDELQSRLNELPSDRDIVSVCLVGKRSLEGMTILQQAGFSRASCMTGGLNAWKAAGYPLEGSNP